MPAILVDLYKKFLEAGNKPEWNAIKTFEVPEGFEQWDLEQLVNFPNEQMVDIFREAGNAHITGYPSIPIKDIRNQHDKNALAVTGKVVALSDVEPDIESIPYVCSKGHDNFIVDGKTPKTCTACGEDGLKEVISRARNRQVYVVQDGNQKMSFVATDDDLLYRVGAGHSTYGFGVLRFRWVNDHGLKRLKKYLDLAYIESKSTNEIQVTSQDIGRFNDMAKDPLHYQLLVESYAPHLYGVIEQKELCLIVVASKGIKRPLNGFLGGPPATGKTDMLIYATKLTPNGQFANTMNISIAGLTSAVETDSETQMRITKPGMLAMADGDVVAITEFQAVKPQEKVGLNDVLERKEVASARADGAIRLPARCAVLIDSNNFAGKWDYGLSLVENLKFLAPNTGAFLSRMDLISITDRITDKQMIRAIAGANYDNSLENEDPLDKYMEDWTDEQGIPHYGINTMRKYIAYVTSLPLPPLDKELKSKFQDNYEEAHENNGDFLVDGRYNRSIITIAKVRARLLLKPQVDESDLQEAMRMVNRSKDIETKTANGRDSGVLLGVKDKQKQNQDEQFWEVFNKNKRKETMEWHGEIQEVEYTPETSILIDLAGPPYNWANGKARKKLVSYKLQGVIIEEFGAGKLTAKL